MGSIGVPPVRAIRPSRDCEGAGTHLVIWRSGDLVMEQGPSVARRHGRDLYGCATRSHLCEAVLCAMIHTERSVSMRKSVRKLRAFLIAMGAWQLVCLAVIFAYARFSQSSAYSSWFGSVQTTYGRLAGGYLALVVLTSPATLLTLTLFDRLWGRPVRGAVLARTFGVWQLVVAAALTCSYELGLPYKINQLGWRLLGPPKEIYSFVNLLHPRLIAWLVCTVPVVLGVLWWYSKSDSRSARAFPVDVGPEFADALPGREDGFGSTAEADRPTENGHGTFDGPP